MAAAAPLVIQKRRLMQPIAMTPRPKKLAKHVPINCARTALQKLSPSSRKKELVQLVRTKEMVAVAGKMARVTGTMAGVTEMVGVEDHP